MTRIREKIACFALFFPFFTLFFRAGSVRLALQSKIAARRRAGRRGLAGPIAIVFKDAALTRGAGPALKNRPFVPIGERRETAESECL